MKSVERAPSMFTPPSPAAAEACVTCGREVTTRYCPHCGEMRASDRSYSMVAFIREHVIEALASLDGRVIRTAVTLFRKPGELTAAFMRGNRVPYLPPLQCFLLFNLAYFLWAGAMHSSALETPLKVQLQGMPYSATARTLVAKRLAHTGETEKEFAIRFDAIASAQARSLVLVMVPAFALVVAIATIGRRRRLAVQHLVFSLHTYSFFLVALPVVTVVIGFPLAIALHAFGVKEGVYGYDAQFSTVLLLCIATYLAMSARRAYELSRARAALAGVVCIIGLAAIVQLYRGLLFFVTLNSM